MTDESSKDWYMRIPRPISGISDEMFDWGRANITHSAEFINCWGLRWNLIKTLNALHIEETDRSIAVSMLQKYKAEYDKFLEKSWASPPKQLRDKPFVWGSLISHCVLFEKVMISNALVNALIPEKNWSSIQKICSDTVNDLKRWKNKNIQDVTLSIPYYASIHAYAGFRQCLPKLNEQLANYPRIDYTCALRVGVHALKFLKEADNIFSISNLNWKKHYTFLQTLNWHILALKALNINTQETTSESGNMQEYKDGELHVLYYNDVDTSHLDVSKYTLTTFCSGANDMIPGLFTECANIVTFAAQFQKQKNYVDNLCLQYPTCIPRALKSTEYDDVIAKMIDEVDIVKT
jgi:hypothetical protein